METEARKNPIRKVVNLLQQMLKKVEEEEKVETEMYDKFMCYCDTGGAELGKSVKDAETKIPQLESSIDETSSAIDRLKYDLKLHKKDRKENQAASTEGTSIRKKEVAAFTKESAEYKANIAALGKAIKAVKKGMSGSAFLQGEASAFQRLRKIAIDGQLADNQRDVLVAFLSQGSGNSMEGGDSDSDGSSYTPDYQPRSGEVSGALQQLKEDMEKSLATAKAQETKASQDFEAMEAARQREIAALTRAIEDKTQQVGDLSVKLAEMKSDYDETKKTLSIDSKFLADLAQGCDGKRTEWAARQKMRSEEKLAIAETIKILNDDDALDLFKKTLPGGPKSLIQIQVSAADVRDEALRILHSARLEGQGEPLQLSLLALAIRGKKIGFTKVLKMIDGMVTLLKKEQETDDLHKQYCETTIEQTDQNLKVASQAVEDRQKAIDKQTTAVKVLAAEIDAIVEGIKNLDKQVQEATKQRKSENAEFSANRASQTSAKELLELAKKRLGQFYGDQAKAQALLETSTGDSFQQAVGFLQVASREDGPDYAKFGKGGTTPPPPESFSSYKKKGRENKGVVGMIDWLIQDVNQQLAEMTAEEDKAQQDYEKFMTDSEKKRREDSKRISKKTGVKAGMEEEIVVLEQKKASEIKVRDSTAQFLSNLHKECDWDLANYQKRKQSRNGEIEALQKAKALLSGDSYDWMAKNRPKELDADMNAKAAADKETYITRGASSFMQMGIREQRLALRTDSL